jgi:Domain of unknown function (DUF4388)
MARVPQAPRSPAAITDEEVDGARPSGFDGRVWCSSLADLVQLECLSGARAVMTVISPGRRGTLFFNAGAVCHATVGDLTQEEAALEILSWEYGTFEQAPIGQASWPERTPIAASWQQLVMCAAQRRDEAALRPEGATPPSSWIRPLPAPRGDRGVSPTPHPELANLSGVSSIPAPTSLGNSAHLAGRSIEGHSIEGHSVEGSRIDGGRVQCHSAVLLGAHDEVLAARGAPLSGLAAYLHRLTTLIATDLGAEGPTGLLLDGPDQLLLMSATDGHCVAFELNQRLTLSQAVRCLQAPATFRAVVAALTQEERGHGMEF